MATTTETVTVDGVVLNTLAYNIRTGAGRYVPPALRGEDIVVPGRSGSIYVPNKVVGVGEFAWAMWVTGANEDGTIPSTASGKRQQFETNMAKLLRIFSRRTTLSYAVCVQANSTSREGYFSVIDRVEPEVMAGKNRAEFIVVGMLPDAYWQDTTETTQSTAQGSSLPKTLSLSSFAGMTGYIEDAVLTIYGPIQSPKVTDSDSGIWFQYNDTISAGEYVQVNCATWEAWASDDTDVTRVITHGGSKRFLVISPMAGTSTTPVVTLSGSGGGSSTYFSVTARRKWLTA